jgi:hypothetical protein
MRRDWRMINPPEALGLAAQIAVTLTGFTGVVAVFGANAVHEWDEADRFRLRLLLASSIVSLVLSLLALVLLAADLDLGAIWRIGSTLAFAVFILSAADNIQTFRRLGPARLNAVPGGNVVFLSTSVASVTVALLQLFNAISLGAFWPFFLDIVFWMLMALLQFARLVLLRRSNSSALPR